MKRTIDILDCTLRDGSYLIDYSFTAEDTYVLALGLARAGFKMIEIGHGTGLRSSVAGMGQAMATDQEYLEAARRALQGADVSFGMFFIPGIANKEDLDLAASLGMGFVRIGTNVTEVEKAAEYIDHAKGLGLDVSANLMKSYVVSTKKFVEQARKAAAFGADVITVVDSAGGMFPEDVRRYVEGVVEATDKKVGFHGHNNLQMAVANTLEAVRSGASVVDTTLRGMGRSAGNAQTEIIAMALDKMGYVTGIDSYRTMDLSKKLVRPMMHREQGVDDIGIVSGMAQFHSSFMGIVRKVAEEEDVDVRRLITKVSEVDKVHITEDLARQEARRLKASIAGQGHFEGDFPETRLYPPTLNVALDEESALASVTERAKKTGKPSVFSFTLAGDGKTRFPFVRQSSSMVIGNCEAGTPGELGAVIARFDGAVDWILLDSGCPEARSLHEGGAIKTSSVAFYSEERVNMLSVCSLLACLRPKGKVLLLAEDRCSAFLESCLAMSGLDSEIGVLGRQAKTEELLRSAEVIVASNRVGAGRLTADHVSLLQPGVAVYTLGPNLFGRDFWEGAMNAGVALHRVDTRVGLAVELELSISTCQLLGDAGSAEMAGTHVVSGGVLGACGSVVVDSVKKPTTVIGIADGFGGVMETTSEYEDRLQAVRVSLIENLLR